MFPVFFSGCSCGGSGQKDAVDYDKVRKNKETAGVKTVSEPAARPPEKKEPVKPEEGGAPVQKILNEARKNGKIEVKPAAPGREGDREKLKKTMRSFKFDRDFNDEAIADIVKNLSDKTGFKFKADEALAPKKITMRSSGRKLAVFIRELERMGVQIILSPENDILLRSGENKGFRGFARGGARPGAERPAGDKFPAGVRQDAGKKQGQPGEHKAAPDADVFDDTDIF